MKRRRRRRKQSQMLYPWLLGIGILLVTVVMLIAMAPPVSDSASASRSDSTPATSSAAPSSAPPAVLSEEPSSVSPSGSLPSVRSDPVSSNQPEVTTFTTAKGYTGITKNGLTYIDGVLIANKTYSLPSTYGTALTDATQAAFSRMQQAAAADGLNIYISSGFRSYDTQKKIYANFVSTKGQAGADAVSARAGHSEHQTGLAFDVNIINSSFAGTPEAIWLEQNCYKFGFILRYPEGKTDETGYSFEPWHFRYVGEELAEKLYNNGDWRTLEDYFGITSVYP